MEKSLAMRKATILDEEKIFEISYRAHRKLISENKGSEYGGMSLDDIKKNVASVKRGEIYLFYRKEDPIPVAMVSILRQDAYPNYENQIKEIIENDEIPRCDVITAGKVALLNAIAVRPELWGQGYGKQSLKQLVRRMKALQGVKILVGNYFPSEERDALLKRVSSNKVVHTSEQYKRKRKNGEILERRRFAFVI